MKHFIRMACIGFILMVLLNGCGLLYTNVKGPIHSNAGVSSIKTGTACTISILGLFATGDASIKAAMEDGGVKKVATVDFQVISLFIFGVSFCTIVTGEE